jgi:hypothetical protein
MQVDKNYLSLVIGAAGGNLAAWANARMDEGTSRA